MKNREKHLSFLKQTFHCEFMQPVLTNEEYLKLCRIGAWMEALYLVKIDPITNKQRQFLTEVRKENPPLEENALIFWKYLKRKELWEKGNLKAEKVRVKDDREDWKKIRKMKF